jgi:PST family polysaccharide transporter
LNNFIKNILALYSVQIVRLILPLLMLPMLTSRLSDNDFGVYIYTVSLSVWLSLVVEYGFNISSTRMITLNSHRTHIRDVVIKTQSAKYLLSIPLLSLIPIGYFFVPVLNDELGWAITMYALGVLTALMPQYYYQGIEKLKLFGFIEVVTGFLLLLSLYFFAEGENADEVIMFSLIMTRLFALIYTSLLMYRNIKIKFFSFCFFCGIKQIKKCSSIFLFQLVVSLYTVFNIVFLGFFVSAAQLGIYGVAERLIKAGLGFIGQASNVFFPRINILKTEGSQNFNKFRFMTLCLFTIVGFIGLILVTLLSPFIITWLFNGKYQQSIVLINIMAWVIPAIAISNVLSLQYLVIDGLENVLNKVVVIAGAINLGLAYYMIKNYGYNGMAYTWVLIEWGICLTLGIVVICKSTNILNIRRIE